MVSQIFCEQRGQWKAATQSQEFLRTIQRYYNNAYIDPEKQDAINVFLGHFQPQQGKPALWKLDSDQHYNIGRQGTLSEETGRFIKRSLSDGNISYQQIHNETLEGSNSYINLLFMASEINLQSDEAEIYLDIASNLHEICSCYT